jgi:transketolase
MAKHKGLAYIRTTRPATPLIYGKDEKFPIGGSKVLRKSQSDVATVIGAGLTVHEALKAYDELKDERISVRIIDAYSVEPIDKDNLSKEVEKAGKKVVVVEDHFQNGGLGDAVAQALSGKAEIVHLAVKDLPRSGKPEELLDKYGIDASHIKKAVKELISR